MGRGAADGLLQESRADVRSSRIVMN